MESELEKAEAVEVVEPQKIAEVFSDKDKALAKQLAQELDCLEDVLNAFEADVEFKLSGMRARIGDLSVKIAAVRAGNA